MLPVEHNDPINAKILAVSEDKIEGFVREPFEEIANRSGVGVEDVMARIGAMLRARTIRRRRSGAALAAVDQPGRGRTGSVEGAGREDRHRVRLYVSARSVFRSRCPAVDRHRQCGV